MSSEFSDAFNAVNPAFLTRRYIFLTYQDVNSLPSVTGFESVYPYNRRSVMTYFRIFIQIFFSYRLFVIFP